MNSTEKIQFYLRQHLPFRVSESGEVILLEKKTAKVSGKKTSKKDGKVTVWQDKEIVDSLAAPALETLPLPSLTAEPGEISGKTFAGIPGWSQQGNSVKVFRNGLTEKERISLQLVLREYVEDYPEMAVVEKVQTRLGELQKLSFPAGFSVLLDKDNNIIDGIGPSGKSLYGWNDKTWKAPKKITQISRRGTFETVWQRTVSENTREYPSEPKVISSVKVSSYIPTPAEQKAALENMRKIAAEKRGTELVGFGTVKIGRKIYKNNEIFTIKNWQRFVTKKKEILALDDAGKEIKKEVYFF